MHRKLGAYVIGIAVLQVALYGAATWYGDDGRWLFYCDPRMGLFMIETMARGEEVFPGVLSWVSAAALGGVGVGLFRDAAWRNVYLRTEGALSIPTVLAFLVVMLQNVSPSHGLSVPELLVPASVLLAASIAPWCCAWVFMEEAG